MGPHIDRFDREEHPEGTDLISADREHARRDGVTMLVSAATEFGCRSSLEVTPVRTDLTVAMAEYHRGRGHGQHTLVGRAQPGDTSGDGITEHDGCLRRLAQPAEIALPALLASGAEVDFAVLVCAQSFDDSFRDFLYLDRLLAPEGLLVLDRGTEPCTMWAIAEYLSQARAYELRSRAESALSVFRKLGGQASAAPVLPTRWSSARGPDRAAETVAARRRASGPNSANALLMSREGPTLDTAPTRELHLSRSLAREMELQVTELGARLLDAEQRAAEVLRARDRLTAVESELRASHVQVQELRERCDSEVEAHDQTRAQLADAQAVPPPRLRGKLRGLKRRLRARIGQ